MSRNYLLSFVLTTFLVGVSFSQFSDDMESYTSGNPIFENWWTDWDGSGNTAAIASNAQARSGAISASIPGDGATDAVLDLGNKIFGEWGYEMWLYIPSNREAYMNLQGVVPIFGGEWIIGNIFFNQDLSSPGEGLIDNSAIGQVSFDFPHDQWFSFVMNIDISFGLAQATIELYIDNQVVLPSGTPFTDQQGTIPSSLGGINFFSISPNNELYIDDITYQMGFIDPGTPALTFEDMEYNFNEPLHEWWLEPIEVSENFAHDGTRSGLIPGDGTSYSQVYLGERVAGTWGLKYWAYVPSGKEAKMSLQGEVPFIGAEPIVGDVLFNEGTTNPGVGVITDTNTGPVNFDFPHDTWFAIIMNFNLSNGINSATWEMWVDGSEVIPLGTPFRNQAGQYPSSLAAMDFTSASVDNELYIDALDLDNQFVDTNVDPDPPVPLDNDGMEYGPGQALSDWWLSPVLITDEISYEGDYSGLIPGDLTTDGVLSLGNLTEDFWGFEFFMFVPSNQEAYFNLQGIVPITTGESIMGGFYFNPELNSPGVGIITNSPLGEVAFNFPHDEWFRVLIAADYSEGASNPTCAIQINETTVLPLNTPFTNDLGEYPTGFGGVNFKSVSQDVRYFIDNLRLFQNPDILGITNYQRDITTMAPNPSSDLVRFSGILPNESVVFINTLGQRINLPVNESTVNVSSLPSGLYFVILEEGNRRQAIKFLKP